MANKVHKRAYYYSNVAQQLGYGGIHTAEFCIYGDGTTTNRWKLVTCKNCLRLKRRKKRRNGNRYLSEQAARNS